MNNKEPTIEQLRSGYEGYCNDESNLDVTLLEKSMTGATRWGYIEKAIFRRKSDKTYWSVQYEITSGDISWHGLLDFSYPIIEEVFPAIQTDTVFLTHNEYIARKKSGVIITWAVA